MNLGIKGLRVLVTAGAGGIGREIARAFAAEGARVHVCDIDAKALRALAKSDPKITRSKADVSDRNQVAKLFKNALAALKGLDVLVNNAGIAGPTGKVDEIAPEDWDRCLAIDTTGQFNCTRLAVPYMKKQGGGRIVNITIASAKQPGAQSYPTSVSRATSSSARKRACTRTSTRRCATAARSRSSTGRSWPAWTRSGGCSTRMN